jgi:hypothetical protein
VTAGLLRGGGEEAVGVAVVEGAVEVGDKVAGESVLFQLGIIG